MIAVLLFGLSANMSGLGLPWIYAPTPSWNSNASRLGGQDSRKQSKQDLDIAHVYMNQSVPLSSELHTYIVIVTTKAV